MKIAILLSRFPYPLEKGDKLRAYHQIRELSKNHEVHLCALSDRDVKQEWMDELMQYCTSLEVIRLKKSLIYWNVFLQVFTGKPFQIGYFYQSRAAIRVKKYLNEVEPDHIYCQLIRTAEYVKGMFTTPKTLDYMDALSKGMERRMDRASGFRKVMYRTEYKRLLKYEHLIFDYFEHKTIISEQDKKQIYHPQQKDIKVIPNGVSEHFFNRMEVPQKYTLVFTGNMNYPPNIDGAVFLCKTILPLVKQHVPDANVLISGANPHKTVKDLESDDVEISGWVDDMRSSICAAAIYVAPMQIGSGVQNKLLEAMSLGVPCVTSLLANKGLKATPGEHLMVADQPEAYCQIILELLENKSLREKISTQGKDFVRKNFSWEASTKSLVQLFQS